MSTEDTDTWSYSYAGDLVQVSNEAADVDYDYLYNNGLISTLTYPNDDIITNTYISGPLLTSRNHPLTGLTNWVYEPNYVNRSDARGYKTVYLNDSLGRIKEIVYVVN